MRKRRPPSHIASIIFLLIFAGGILFLVQYSVPFQPRSLSLLIFPLVAAVNSGPSLVNGIGRFFLHRKLYARYPESMRGKTLFSERIDYDLHRDGKPYPWTLEEAVVAEKEKITWKYVMGTGPGPTYSVTFACGGRTRKASLPYMEHKKLPVGEQLWLVVLEPPHLSGISAQKRPIEYYRKSKYPAYVACSREEGGARLTPLTDRVLVRGYKKQTGADGYTFVALLVLIAFFGYMGIERLADSAAGAVVSFALAGGAAWLTVRSRIRRYDSPPDGILHLFEDENGYYVCTAVKDGQYRVRATFLKTRYERLQAGGSANIADHTRTPLAL